jgi:two-component system NarL family sensor kinase
MNMYYGILFGMLSFAIIAGGSILVFILYQKRLLKKQEEFYLLDARYKKDLITNTIQSAEVERMRIAKDIHDEIGSIFSSLSLAVNQIKKEDHLSKEQVQISKSLIQTGINSIRRISHAIVPFELELLGLQQTLDNHFNSISSLSGITINFENEYKLDVLNNDTALAIYRIMQELLSNCIKYAQAKNIIVWIKHNKDKNSLNITYRDDGIGLDMENKNLHKGIGLKNIESRIIALEGAVNFNSEPTKGFECVLTIPLNKDNIK